MAGTKQILDRRNAAENISKVTHMMETVSAVRYRHYYRQWADSLGFYNALAQLAYLIVTAERTVEHPLMLGNDPRKMTPEIHAILTNKEVIAINQNPLGRQGRKVRDDGDFEVWSKELHDGTRAVVLFNRSEQDTQISFTWSEIGLPEYLKFTVRDLWKKQDVGKFKGNYTARVIAHGVVMVTVK